MNRVDQFIENPNKALYTLSIPIIVGMLVRALYNIVDTAFVGRLGPDSMAALTFAFPIFFILISISTGIGAGMSSRIARYLGEKKKRAATNAAMHGLLLASVSAFTIAVIGLAIMKPLLTMMGATGSVLKLSTTYLCIIFFGASFMFASFVLNSVFTAQGDSKTPMQVQISALILNIILDPIFIYTLNMGVRGAAIATMVAITFAMLLSMYFIETRSYLKLKLSSFKFSPIILKDILKVTIPASLMMLFISLNFMIMIRFVSYFGTEYVAAYGIVSRVTQLIQMPIIAISIALLTLSGMFFGAKRLDLLKNTLTNAIKVGLLFAVIGGIFFLTLAPYLIRIFTHNTTLITIGANFLRLQLFTIPFFAITLFSSRSMQGMGFGFPSLATSLLRTILLGVPIAYTLIFILDYNYLAVPISMIISGMITSIVALYWLINKLKIRTNTQSLF